MKPQLTVVGHLAGIKLAADQSSAEGSSPSEFTSDAEGTEPNSQLPSDPSTDESSER